MYGFIIIEIIMDFKKKINSFRGGILLHQVKKKQKKNSLIKVMNAILASFFL
jgi:hypothetical protein